MHDQTTTPDERTWQHVWDRVFRADESAAQRRYVLTMFPYPSGDLHMGHAEVFAIEDAIARFWRLRGQEVMNPIGWDSFGLPAENAAIRSGVTPAQFTYANIDQQAATARRYGVSFDWSRRLHTSDPEYYRWTQWLFCRMHEMGLAYRAPSAVNWCPRDATVLANEQVVDGRCERCGATVEQRELTQWFLRITAYADRLLDDMAQLEGAWPEHVLTMQRNWIGRTDEGYRLHDWLVSRQRSWGAPIPVVHCDDCGEVLVPDEQLPVVLPTLRGHELVPHGVSPLAAATAWVETACPRCGRAARRDTDTLDTFVDSSFYFVRYCSPHYAEGLVEPQAARRWLPVDVYVGGVEHAILHLLYARFVTKVLADLGVVEVVEPFSRLVNQGQVLNGGKAMSKSLGNGVPLGAVLDEFGPDAVRLAILFAGAPEDDLDWADVNPAAMRRFLGRVRRLVAAVTSPAGTDAADGDRALRQATHRAVRTVGELVEAGRLNVAIARLMDLVTAATAGADRDGGDPAVREAAEAAVVILSLFAPYTAEEAWRHLGHGPSVAVARWPHADPSLTADERVVAVVQVDGKVRARLDVAPDVTQDALVAAAQASPAVIAALAGRPVTRVVARAPRVVSLVTT